MKAKRRNRLWIALLVVVWSLINGSDAALDTQPVNVAVAVGDTFNLTAEGDTADDIFWIHNSASQTSPACVSGDPEYTGTQSADQTDCTLSGTAAQDTSGSYTASLLSDTSNFVAIVVVIDPTPICSVITEEPVEAGQTANYTCIMTYYATGATSLTTPPTLAWDAACTGDAGTSTHTEISAGESGTMAVSVEYTATGCSIPACTCTATFSFTDPGSGQTFATNDATYTCTNDAVSSCTTISAATTAASGTATADASGTATAGTGTVAAATGAAATEAEATSTALSTNFIISLVFAILAVLTLFFICIIVYNWNKVGPAASAMVKPAPYYRAPAPYPPPAYPPPAYPPRQWYPRYPQPRRPFFPRRRTDYGYGNNMIYY